MSETLRFPSTLVSMNHVMKISIFSKKYKTSDVANEKLDLNATQAAALFATSPLTAGTEAVDQISSVASGQLNNASDEVGRAQNMPSIDICLPIPENITNQFNGNWTAYEPSWFDLLMMGEKERAVQRGILTSFLPAIGKVAKGVGMSRLTLPGAKTPINATGAGVTANIVGSAMGAAPAVFGSTMKTQGIALNPYTMLTYKAPNLRTFNFSWVLSPKNSEESTTLKKIIDTLNKYTLPPELSSGGGAFFAYPEYCKIEFLSRNSQNIFLPIIQDSAILNVSTKFDNKFHKNDFSPLSVALSISIMETVVYTQEGYDSIIPKSSSSSKINSIANETTNKKS